jgi:hypothetical protein
MDDLAASMAAAATVDVTSVGTHAGLEHAGLVAAFLRYPLGPGSRP